MSLHVYKLSFIPIYIQQQSMRHRKLQMLRKYSRGIRMRLFADFTALQEQKYGQYFLQGRQLPPPSPANLSKSEEQGREEEEEELIAQQEALLDGEQVEGEDEGQFSVADYIQLLSPEQRKAFKEDNPQLPPLFFMTKAEKKRYFQSLNKTFHSKMTKIAQRKSKTKKILKFSNEFEVKHFNEKQNVVALGKAKGIKQKYQQQIHFS